MRFEVTRPQKVLFPEAGVTKAELVSYYERVAEHMLPHVRGRPVSMQRFPDGIDGFGFFHKDVPEHFPRWVSRVEVDKRDGTVTHAVISNADTLAYLANQGCITPHVWLSRCDRLRSPDRLVLDFDPTVEDFAAVRRAARDAGDLLRELGLEPFAMVTGSRGIHVWSPLQRRAEFERVRDFAVDLARVMVNRRPGDLTLESRKAKRGDRMLVDVNRNAYAQTAVPPYAVRPRAKAPVATPIRWEELSDSRLRPDRWTVKNIFRRLSGSEDPWAGISSAARGLSEPRRRLDRVLADEL